MQKPNKLPRDTNARAAQIVALSTGQPIPSLTPKVEAVNSSIEGVKTKLPAAVELGRLGGLKGGNARAAVLTKKRRAEIAKLAADARWKKG